MTTKIEDIQSVVNEIARQQIEYTERKGREMSIDEAKEELSRMKGHHYFTHGDEALDMAIHALEMQKKLAEYSGMDICNWVEDYDYEENNISEYEYEASVDNFLIDEEEKS